MFRQKRVRPTDDGGDYRPSERGYSSAKLSYSLQRRFGRSSSAICPLHSPGRPSPVAMIGALRRLDAETHKPMPLRKLSDNPARSAPSLMRRATPLIEPLES